MRVALYARFSSDQQRQTSIADQLRLARARAATEGWAVVIERCDEGVSGSTPFALRPGSKALLADALAKRFDMLIVEGLDRAFRDLGEQEQIVKRIEHRGIRIIGTSDGYDTLAKGRKVMRVARGLVNEIYLDDLRDKTHRGLAGQFDRGLSAGGRSYGYRTEAATGGRRLVVEPVEAEHVRWVFQRFVDGWSPVAIAHELNRLGVPSPRGGKWAVSAIHGSATRGLGLLNNELYAGRVLWNRRQWLKDPESGSRRYIERPREEWQIREQPELRVIDEATWSAARRRMDAKAQRGAATSAANKGGRPPRTLFGGLLRCPTCAGAVVAVDSRRYGCSVHKDRGPAACTNAHTVPRRSVDSRLVAVLRDELLEPDALAELQSEVRLLLAEQRRDAGAASGDARKRLAEVKGELVRLADAIAAVGISETLATRLRTSEFERATLETQLAAEALPAADEIMASVMGRYRAMLVDLHQRLEGESDRERTREIVRQMLGPITLLKGDDGATYAEMKNPAEQLLAGGDSLLTVVARARNSGSRLIRVWG